MPILPILTGFSPGHSGYGYSPITGDYDFVDTEAYPQFMIRDSYTLANAYIYITSNTKVGAHTLISRVNGANGNMAVVVGAGLTGVFQDLVNSDALVDGDLVCLYCPTTGVGNVKLSLWAHTLQSVANSMILGATYPPGLPSDGGDTINYQPAGVIYDNGGAFAEADAGYTFRTASTLSNLRCYIEANTLTGASTIRIRVNVGNGNEILNIGAGTSGSFEDVGNTDTINIGDEVNYQQINGAGAANAIHLNLIQVLSTCAARQMMVSEQAPFAATDWLAGTSYWCTIEGRCRKHVNEVWDQVLAQAAFTARNMFARVSVNTGDFASVLTLRINGGNGTLTITVPAGNTGTFEDLGNTDAIIATDLLNYQVVNAAGSNSLRYCTIGIEAFPAAEGWTGKISGVTNPAKIMGVDVANIAKVKGIA